MFAESFEVLVFLIGERHIVGLVPFGSKLLDLMGIHNDLTGLKSKSLNKAEVGISGKGSKNPEEGLFILVV
jgi:hypothetical protein